MSEISLVHDEIKLLINSSTCQLTDDKQLLFNNISIKISASINSEDEQLLNISLTNNEQFSLSTILSIFNHNQFNNEKLKIDKVSKEFFNAKFLIKSISIPKKSSTYKPFTISIDFVIEDLSFLSKNLPELYKNENLKNLEAELKINSADSISCSFRNPIRNEKNRLVLIDPVLALNTKVTSSEISSKFDLNAKCKLNSGIPTLESVELSNVEMDTDGNVSGIIVKWENALGIPKMVIENALVSFNYSSLSLELLIECTVRAGTHDFKFRGILNDDIQALVATRLDPISIKSISRIFGKLFNSGEEEESTDENSELLLKDLTFSISTTECAFNGFSIKKGIVISCNISIFKLIKELKCSIQFNPTTLSFLGLVQLNQDEESINALMQKLNLPSTDLFKLKKESLTLFFQYSILTPTTIAMGMDCKIQFAETGIVLVSKIYFTTKLDNFIPQFMIVCGLDNSLNCEVQETLPTILADPKKESSMVVAATNNSSEKKGISILFKDKPEIQTLIQKVEKYIRFKSGYIILSTLDYYYAYETSRNKDLLSMNSIGDLNFDIKSNTLNLILVLESNNNKWYEMNDQLKYSFQFLYLLISSRLVRKDDMINTDDYHYVTSQEFSINFDTILRMVIGNGRNMLQPAQVGLGVEFRNLKFPLGSRLAFVPMSFALSFSQNTEVVLQVGVELIPVNVFERVLNILNESIEKVLDIAQDKKITVKIDEKPSPLLFSLEGIISTTDVQLTGRMQGDWKHPFGLKWLTAISDCELGVDINYATIATTGLPSGASIRCNATLVNDKKCGMYLSINENIVDDFIILYLENLGFKDIVQLTELMINVKFSSIKEEYEYIRIVKAGIGLSAKTMMIRDGYTTLNIASGDMVVKQRKIPMGITLFSDILIELPNILNGQKIEGIIASVISPKYGIQLFGKVSSFNLWDGNIVVSGFNIDKKLQQKLIVVENKSLKKEESEKDKVDFKLIQDLFPSSTSESGEKNSKLISIENCPEIYLKFIPNNFELPEFKVSGMIEFLDMFKFGAEVMFKPSSGECSFGAEIELAEGISVQFKFSQTATGPKIKGKVKGLEKLAFLIKHAIESFKAAGKKKEEPIPTSSNEQIEKEIEKEESTLRKCLAFIKDKLHAEVELKKAQKELNTAKRNYSNSIKKELSKMGNEILNITNNIAETGKDVYERLGNIIEKNVLNKCIDEFNKKQENYEECIHDIQKAIENFKNILLNDYCKKNNQLMKSMNTIEEIRKSVSKKLSTLSHQTRESLCSGAVYLISLLEVRFEITNVDFLIIDHVLALKIDYHMGRDSTEKSIILKNVNLRKLKSIVTDIAYHIIDTSSPNTSSIDKQEPQTITADNKQEQENTPTSQPNRRKFGCSCFR
ncbi:predicted protein [Naegleria gruberi]|uniref:Predicted protein n=1 Tax=Naegleria gruberi TaxID=5762 RepID=D2VWR2_NAEGR|nr:uncharacterized protein NAEGRDRAFT_81503 [Naegleria gruberi]EFC38664.1 predicted protein [Naegleria gruberi]|eukprot:XP_002671408.1 predicted protein [Naegleria gruberi strain NEG-M]